MNGVRFCLYFVTTVKIQNCDLCSYRARMETVINEVEPNETLQSPPRRRRSTFFERRESIVPQIQSENIDPNPSEMDNSDHKSNQELFRYYEQLLSEKEKWKKEVKNRRHKYHDIRQQYQMAVQAPGRSRMSYSALSDDDIEFLKGKVNISKLVDTQKQLHKSVKETMAQCRRVNQLEDIVLHRCERRVKNITDYIFENSTLEPVEQ